MRTFTTTVTAAAAAALLLTGCSGSMSGGHGMASPATSTTGAATLRTGLNTLFAEHVLLASRRHRRRPRRPRRRVQGGRRRARRQLASPSAQAIGSVYGQDAEDAFLPLWRRHIGFVVDYTVGVAAEDKAKQDKAVSDLVAYTQDFGAFLASANPNLPKDAVAELVKHHVLTLKDVIDAQAAGDQAQAFAAMRTACAHMAMIADPLAGAIVKQFPDKFPGAIDVGGRRPPHHAEHGAPGARLPRRARHRRRARRA